MRFSIISQQVDEIRLGANDSASNLAALVEKCYGSIELPEGVPAQDGVFVRAFFNWFRLVHLVGGGHGYLLDKTQRRVHHMLLDWWTGTYKDAKGCIVFLLSTLSPVIFHAVVLNDQQRCRIRYVSDSGAKPYTVIQKAQFDVEFWEEAKYSHSTIEQLEQCVSHYLQFLSDGHHDIFQTVWRVKANKFRQDSLQPHEVSDYDQIMWRLFVSQFCDAGDVEAQGRTNADFQSLIAAGEAHYADAEFLARKNIVRGKPSQEEDDALMLYVLKAPAVVEVVPQHTADDVQICVSEASNFEWPRILEQGLLSEISSLQDMAVDVFGGWPLYLWRRSDAKLVKARDLAVAGKPPAYTAISHAGRKGKEDSSYMIPNSWVFPIPSNDRFNVESLTEELKQTGGAIETEYVWMNLLCVPQCKENDEGDENGELYQLKLKEISRQCTIFRNAARVVGWPLDQ